jgi:hypothetical protein
MKGTAPLLRSYVHPADATPRYSDRLLERRIE